MTEKKKLVFVQGHVSIRRLFCLCRGEKRVARRAGKVTGKEGGEERWRGKEIGEKRDEMVRKRWQRKEGGRDKSGGEAGGREERKQRDKRAAE